MSLVWEMPRARLAHLPAFVSREMALVVHLKHYQKMSQQQTECKDVFSSSSPSKFLVTLTPSACKVYCDIDQDSRWWQPSSGFFPAAQEPHPPSLVLEKQVEAQTDQRVIFQGPFK